ncbi:unnamed protein product, partial [Mesorhabditis belari]|uniref:Integrator complex subunit 2 n=1 Tax=Mesorhabditis belari TaxID=2138241 RepID=A0AAF3EBV5_9BILA
MRKLLDGDPMDQNLHEWVPESDLPMAIKLFSLALFFIPGAINCSTIVNRLISCSHASTILTGLICSLPSYAECALFNLLDINNLSEETVRGKNRFQMIVSLVTLCPSMAGVAVETLSQNRRDALLAVKLAALRANNQEFIRFLTYCLIDRSSHVFSAVHKTSGRAAFASLQERVMKILEATVAEKELKANEEFVECLALVHLQSNAKLTAAEVKLLINYLCLKIDDSGHIHAVVCTLLSLPALTSAPPGMAPGTSIDPKVGDYLQWLKARVTSSQHESATLPCVLIVALYLWSNRVEEINKFLTDSLLCRVTLGSRHFTSVRALLQVVFPEKELAQICASMPITFGLHKNDDSQGLLPVHWICDLMSQKVFQKHNVDVGNWVQRQIQHSLAPIHPLLSDAIDRLAEYAAQAEIRQGLERKFCEVFIGDLMDESMLVKRLLVLQYLLTYRQRFTASGRKEDNPYKSIYQTIPIRYLLSVIEANAVDFAPIRLSLVGSSIALFPYMRPTRKSIELVRNRRRASTCQLPTGFEIQKILCGSDRAAALKAAKHLENASLSDLVKLLPVIVQALKSVIPPLEVLEGNDGAPTTSLDDGNCNRLAETLSNVWLDLEAIVPRQVIEKTLIAFQETPFMVDQAYAQPCLVFDVDRRVFASPPHFMIFLPMLSFFLEAGRAEKERAVLIANMKTGQQYEDKQKLYQCEEREILFSVLDHTQRAAAVQLLIEICDQTKNKFIVAPFRLEKIRMLAFNYIHSIFIRDIQVMKLVLFETFPLHMLRSVIEGIPSMHVAQNFIQEMMVFPENKRRIFTISLIIEVFRKYRVKATLPLVTMTLNALCTLIRYVDSRQVLCLVNGVIEELGELALTFPQLAETVMNILGQVSLMAESRLAFHSTGVVSSKTMERSLVKRVKVQADLIAQKTLT